MLSSELPEVHDRIPDVSDGLITHLSPDGDLKAGEREPGDVIVVEYAKVLTFFVVTDHGTAEYKTSLCRFVC